MGGRWIAMSLGLCLCAQGCTRLNPGFGATDSGGEGNADSASGGTSGASAGPGTAAGVGSNSGSGPASTVTGTPGTAGSSPGTTTMSDPTNGTTEGSSEAGTTVGVLFDMGGETEGEVFTPPCVEILGDHCFDMTSMGANVLLDRAAEADLNWTTGVLVATDWGQALDCTVEGCVAVHEGVDLGNNGITLEVWFELTQLTWPVLLDQPIFDVATIDGGVAVGVARADGGEVVATARYADAQRPLPVTGTTERQCVAIVSDGVDNPEAFSVRAMVIDTQPLLPKNDDLDFSDADLNLGPFAGDIPVVIHGVRIRAGVHTGACMTPML